MMASSYSLSIQRHRESPKGDTSINIIYNGRRVAYLSYFYDNPYTIWISSVYVQRDHRRKGLAKLLMNKVIQEHGDKEMQLVPCPFKDRQLSEGQLKKFYSTFGFADAISRYGLRHMSRSPVELKQRQSNSGQSSLHISREICGNERLALSI